MFWAQRSTARCTDNTRCTQTRVYSARGKYIVRHWTSREASLRHSSGWGTWRVSPQYRDLRTRGLVILRVTIHKRFLHKNVSTLDSSFCPIRPIVRQMQPHLRTSLQRHACQFYAYTRQKYPLRTNWNAYGWNTYTVGQKSICTPNISLLTSKGKKVFIRYYVGS